MPVQDLLHSCVSVICPAGAGCTDPNSGKTDSRRAHVVMAADNSLSGPMRLFMLLFPADFCWLARSPLDASRDRRE